jgi:hypothetical protein
MVSSIMYSRFEKVKRPSRHAARARSLGSVPAVGDRDFSGSSALVVGEGTVLRLGPGDLEGQFSVRAQCRCCQKLRLSRPLLLFLGSDTNAHLLREFSVVLSPLLFGSKEKIG